MTFIGIACRQDSADLVTDTASYSPDGAKFRASSKQTTFAHLGAALAMSGNPAFAARAEINAKAAALCVDSYDELITTAPTWLGFARDEAFGDDVDLSSPYVMDGTAFLVGPSTADGRYVGYAFSASKIDQPRKITTAALRPTPFSVRPPRTDLVKAARALREMKFPEDEIQSFHQNWATRPELPVPEGDDEWIGLATLTRRERSLTGPVLRVWIGGSLVHTTLTPGSAHSRVIHEFNDRGAELGQLVYGSLHPVAQLAPCTFCPSGLPAIDCCVRREFSNPCDCRSGRTFGDCCLVHDRDAVKDQLWTTPFDFLQPTAAGRALDAGRASA